VGILDELKESLELLRVDESVGVERMVANNVCLDHVQALVNSFEREHPGLVDNTVHCAECGNPVVKTYGGCRLFTMEELYGDSGLFNTDHEAYDALYRIRLCGPCGDTLAERGPYDARELCVYYGVLAGNSTSPK
jgi:hypothetical protein